DAALATPRRFEERPPVFGRLSPERGHCYRTAGHSAHAIEASRRAVALNPSLLASWKALAVLCRAAGQTGEAAAAAEQALQLERLPGPVLSASGMLAEGDVYRAERILRQFLLKYGNHLEAMRLLA